VTDELDRDGPDEGFHEIQLSGKQLVFLFMAATLVAVVVFLFGVWVGRGVEARRAAHPTLPPAAATSAEPVAAPADVGAPARGETLTYPQRLQSDRPVDERLATPPPPPVAETAPVAEPPPPPAAPATEAGWVIQVAALRDREAALAVVKRLADKQYPVFLLEPEPGAPAPAYRVRVGRFRERAEAERVARRLEREERFKPFITR
jgi:cell division septation protein DedD